MFSAANDKRRRSQLLWTPLLRVLRNNSRVAAQALVWPQEGSPSPTRRNQVNTT